MLSPSKAFADEDDDDLQLSPKTNLKKVKTALGAKKIALLIGVWRYKHRTWNDLRYPKQDVKKIRRLLSKYGQFDQVMSLTKRTETTQKSIRQSFKWLKAQVRSPQDTVVIYISGHGSIAQSQKNRPPERYVVATDSKGDLPKTGIAIREIKHLMQQLPSKRKALILASCYVGSQKVDAALRKSIASGIKGTYNLGIISRTTLILSAAGYMQPAYETDQLQGDVYTHFFAKCARKLTQQNKDINTTTIHRCATQKTYQYVRKNLGREQLPSIESKITGKDNIYLFGKNPKVAMAVNKKPHGWLKVKRGRFRRIVYRPKGSKGAGQSLQMSHLAQSGHLILRLPQGQYTMHLVTPSGKTITREVEVEANTHQVLTPQGVQISLDDDDDDDLNMLDIWGGGYFEAGADLQPALNYFGMRFGAWFRYASFGATFFLGYGLDQHTQQPLDFPLLRFGLPFQLGYTIQAGNFDFFLNIYTEVGIWTVRSQLNDEMVFYAAYGPQLRIRWWYSENAAVRISAGVYYTYSPDQQASPKANISLFDQKPNIWTHRLNILISIGIDGQASNP